MPKVKVTVWLEDKFVVIVDNLAQTNGLSRSAVIAEYLERSLREKGEQAGLDLIVPVLREDIRKQFSNLGDRITALLYRTALESATGHSLMYTEAVHRLGETHAKTLHRQAHQAALERIKRPIEALEKLKGDNNGSRQGELSQVKPAKSDEA